MPTKNTLRILVALQIAAALGGAVAATVSIPSLVREYALPASVFSVAPEIFWLANILALALLVVAAGLCFFADIFRTLYVGLTVATLLLNSLHSSVSSGSMDLLQQTDAVLRGAIMALIYFSPLSDLYKPRPRGDLHSTQRLFRYVILAQIPLILASVGAGFLSGLNTNIPAINDAMDHSHPGRGVLAVISLLAYVIVNVGLYRFWRGARSAYLIVTVVAILETLYLSPSATSAGAEIFTIGLTILNGVILGLAYLPPLRVLFDPTPGTRAVPAPSPVMSPPVGVAPPVAVADTALPTTVAQAATAAVVEPAAPAAVVAHSAPSAAVDQVAPAARPAIAEHFTFCEACGARSQGGKFCTACGAPLPRKVLCPKCGMESQPGKKFCRECGTSLPG